jgi:hypothetical protein
VSVPIESLVDKGPIMAKAIRGLVDRKGMGIIDLSAVSPEESFMFNAFCRIKIRRESVQIAETYNGNPLLQRLLLRPAGRARQPSWGYPTGGCGLSFVSNNSVLS